MWNSFLDFFQPEATTIARRQLKNAQFELAQAETMVEDWTAYKELLTKRIARLRDSLVLKGRLND